MPPTPLPARLALRRYANLHGWIDRSDGHATDVYAHPVDTHVHATLEWLEGPEGHRLIIVKYSMAYVTVTVSSEGWSEDELIAIATQFLEDAGE